MIKNHWNSTLSRKATQKFSTKKAQRSAKQQQQPTCENNGSISNSSLTTTTADYRNNSEEARNVLNSSSCASDSICSVYSKEVTPYQTPKKRMRDSLSDNPHSGMPKVPLYKVAKLEGTNKVLLPALVNTTPLTTLTTSHLKPLTTKPSNHTVLESSNVPHFEIVNIEECYDEEYSLGHEYLSDNNQFNSSGEMECIGLNSREGVSTPNQPINAVVAGDNTDNKSSIISRHNHHVKNSAILASNNDENSQEETLKVTSMKLFEELFTESQPLFDDDVYSLGLLYKNLNNS